MNALQRIHRSLIPRGILFDLQPTLTNTKIVDAAGVVARLDESAFRADVDRANARFMETIRAGLFASEREIITTVVERFDTAIEPGTEVKCWTGTRIPAAVLDHINRSERFFEVHEDVRLRRLRAL